jgi:hypothetical protein
MKLRRIAPPTAFAATLLHAAAAAPPPGPAPDDATAAWFRSLSIPRSGESCCDVSDCRPVEYRIGPGIYQVLIRRRMPDGSGFRGGNDAWWNVPPDRVLHRSNPTGEAVACWSSGQGVLCFVPAPGT